ncbi:hypothetical protein SNOUR_03105 [Streptomyces noursei ATCC 11455]|uniref:hypothetical protein n=1 Tax=Streptomyces noursei TaxID=1971 RepID=UPI00081C513B|nr:hypothetical protein SNOUR_03105 [Streptomyces noursei ATCC 11455]
MTRLVEMPGPAPGRRPLGRMSSSRTPVVTDTRAATLATDLKAQHIAPAPGLTIEVHDRHPRERFLAAGLTHADVEAAGAS